MALRRNVLHEDNILCELYADTCSDVFDNSDNETLDSDSDGDVPTSSSRKQLRSFTSDSETSTIEEEICELENCDDKTSEVWCKTNKNQVMSVSMESQVSI
jgi:hypothetical protein